MAGGRSYSSLTRRTTTTVDPGTSGTTLTVADSTVFSALDGQFPWTALINWGLTDQEVVNVTARPTGTTLTIARAQDGTSGVAHPIGATVDHGVSARDFNGVTSVQLINNGGSLACTATWQDVPNMSFTLAAGATYRFFATYYYQASGTSPQVSVGMGGTVVPGLLTYTMAIQTNVGGGGGFFTDSVLSNTSRQLPAANTLLNSNCAVVMQGLISVSTAGTLTAQCRTGAGTINVQAGGRFTLEQIA